MNNRKVGGVVKKEVIIELEAIWKTTILDAMQVGVEVANGIFRQQKMATKNGKSIFVWNLINTEVKRALPKERFEVIVSKRGVWEFVLVLDIKSGYLYSFMKGDRFETVRKNYEKNKKLHYLEVLCGINTPYLSETYEQLDFLNVANEQAEEKDEILEKMLMQLKNEVKKHILVTFEISKDKIIAARANVVSENLQIMETEQWQQYITPSYDAMISHIAEEDLQIEEEEIPVLLKPNIQSFPYDKNNEEEVVFLPVSEKDKMK